METAGRLLTNNGSDNHACLQKFAFQLSTKTKKKPMSIQKHGNTRLTKVFQNLLKLCTVSVRKSSCQYLFTLDGDF